MTEDINLAIGTLPAETADDQKEYEIAFILKAEDSGVIKTILENLGFLIAKESAINKIRLAYAIKKAPQAYWGYLTFSGTPDKIKNLSDNLKLNPEVLRFLIISAPSKIKTSRTAKENIQLKSSIKRIKVEKSVPVYEERSRILTNEALEEKIEEILK